VNTKSGRTLKEGKKQYLFTMTLTFLAMLIMVSYMFVSYFSIIKQDAVSIGEKTVLEETEKINNFISKSKNVLQITSLTIEYMMQNNATDEDIKDYLLIESEKYTTEVDKNFTGIYGVFRGKYIDGINWQWEEGFEPERRPWYIKAKEAGGNIAIVSPYKDKQTGRILISVCKMLADGESIIAIDIYLDEIHNIVKSLKVNGNGFGFIFDETGMIVAHCDEKYNGSMLDDNYTDGDITGEAGHIALTGNENLYKKTIGGTEYAIFTKSLENNWNIVMVVEYNVWFGQVKNVLIISVLIAIIILISVSYFCLDSLKNRQRSVEYAHELEEYQSSLENRVKAQTDEICKHINTMILLQENMIESMAMLIEGRDGNTGEHIFNTKTYLRTWAFIWIVVFTLSFLLFIAMDVTINEVYYFVDSDKVQADITMLVISDLHSCRYGKGQFYKFDRYLR